MQDDVIGFEPLGFVQGSESAAVCLEHLVAAGADAGAGTGAVAGTADADAAGTRNPLAGDGFDDFGGCTVVGLDLRIQNRDGDAGCYRTGADG